MPIAEIASATACAHCGLAVPPARRADDGAPSFCCAGCQAVHALLHEHGLERYYDVREALPAAGGSGPVRPSDRSYAELDRAPAVGAGRATAELYLENVHCAACVWLVERLPALVPGVVEARLDLAHAIVRIAWDPRVTALSAAARGLDRLGYPPHPARGLAAREHARRESRRLLARIGVAGAAAGNVMAIAFALYAGVLDGMEPEYRTFFRWASLAVAAPSLAWGGGLFVRSAWAALRARVLHMDVPIAVALVVGTGHGVLNTVRGGGEVYFDTLPVLVFLLLVGRYLQRRQHRLAADATTLAASLVPAVARVIEADTVRETPVETLRAGALLEVRAGELVPVDGVVVEGRSTLDRALLNGESRPVGAGPGDAVEAGTLNLTARLAVRAERTGEETRAGRLMALVVEHAGRRAPLVRLADRLAARFTAAVLILAGVTVALWWRTDPEAAIAHAVALLIVTCPCALALATPLAMTAALGRAARRGFLIKGGDVLEKLARPGRMWLDKTGTLSEGRVALVRWAGDPAARSLAAAAEAGSAHPVARALAAAAPAAGAPGEAVETPGAGVEARVAGRAVVVGAPAFVTARADAPPPEIAAALAEIVAEALTPVLVAVDGRITAAAGLGDPVRGDARAALVSARARGWRPGVLSGDHPDVVAAVGRGLGLPPAECRGGVTPEGKAAAVAAAADAGPVVMVGDGVNDAAALAAATVGIAVHGGAEAALEAADVFVARPGVARIIELLDGARRTMAVVRRNLALSLAYNAVAVALAMAGRLDPLVAAVLMPLSSLSVITSSYRARTFGDGPGGA